MDSGDSLSSPWKDQDKVALLKELAAEGHSASLIAARIGGGVSRNAVIGKIHRLGLASTGRARPRSRTTSKQEAQRTARKSGWKRYMSTHAGHTQRSRVAEIFAAEPFTPAPQIVIPEHEQKTLIELEDSECRWPLNDGNPFKFCARPRVPGLVYCEGHARVAYAPTRMPHAPIHAGRLTAHYDLHIVTPREKEDAW